MEDLISLTTVVEAIQYYFRLNPSLNQINHAVLREVILIVSIKNHCFESVVSWLDRKTSSSCPEASDSVARKAFKELPHYNGKLDCIQPEKNLLAWACEYDLGSVVGFWPSLRPHSRTYICGTSP
jgi:hypothetical protein